MLRALRLSVGLLLAASLGACVGPVPKIDASQADLAKLTTVAVIRPPERKEYTVLHLGHAGMAFGLIGGLIAASDMQNKQTKLTEVLAKEKIAMPAALTERLVAGLAKEGYTVVAEDAPWEEKDGRVSLQMEQIKSDADAVLVVLPTIVGFVDGGMVTSTGGAYVPTVALVVQLLGKDRKTVLYRGYHVTGWKPMAEGWRHTPGTAKYPNFEDLMLKPDLTAASLVEASDLVTQSIVLDLRRQPAGAAAPAEAAAAAPVPPAAGAPR